jgi:hypothetical protein
MPKIEKTANGVFRIDVKRFYLPFKLQDECPECGEHHERDFNDHYLFHPFVNKPTTFGCTCYECGYEWEIQVLLTLDMELVNAK